jgi:uncharacterized protein with PhoU and TrkA domain
MFFKKERMKIIIIRRGNERICDFEIKFAVRISRNKVKTCSI